MFQTMLCWVFEYEGTSDNLITALDILVAMIFSGLPFLPLLSFCDSREILRLLKVTVIQKLESSLLNVSYQ